MTPIPYRMERDTSWRRQAACWGCPDLMFPSDAAGVTLAQQICDTCPVIDACRTYALHFHEEHGVWGGTSERERKKIWRRWQRGLAA